MEVHHHPHAGKKKFKEYFFEFIMIFLAVFMGFMAENIREHFVEKHRASDYMKELAENLKYDTTRIHVSIILSNRSTTGMDSLRAELKQAILGNINSNRLYYLEKKYASDYGIVAFNTSAITELKNSGSLRLIRNKKLVEEINDYYQRRIYAAEFSKPSPELSEDRRRILNEFFKWEYFDDEINNAEKHGLLTRNEYDYSFILFANPTMQLLKTKSEDLERLYNMVSQYEYRIKKYEYFLMYVKELAIKLIDEIQKEYHFEMIEERNE